MAARMYLVHLTRKKVLVEATSQEAAIREATKPMVKSVTIPTALEVARMVRVDNIEVISASATPPEPVQQETPPEGGVGRMGIADGDDSGGEPSEQG